MPRSRTDRTGVTVSEHTKSGSSGIAKRRTNTYAVYFWQQNVRYHANGVIEEMWAMFKTVLSNAN